MITHGIPSKITSSIDFNDPLSQHIFKYYDEDPLEYNTQITLLNNCRRDMMDAGNNTSGRNAAYKYYAQLEHLSQRFPIHETGVKIEFVWLDAFTKTSVSQFSVAFEKASVLFNIAAICSTIAANAEEGLNGLKTAYNYYQTTAGLLQFINDNFLHPPSKDLSRESISVLVGMMLAQAQECFVESVLEQGKVGNIVAKLSTYISSTYISIGDDFKSLDIKNQFPRVWIVSASIKVKYYHALANLHRSILAEEENEYGLSLSYLTVANNSIKEALQISSNDTSMIGSINILNLISPSSQSQSTRQNQESINDTVKTLATSIAQKLQVSTKDNDMIYNCTITIPQSLPLIEKLCAVKATPFHTIFPNNQKDIPSIIGDDIFIKLVPLRVHEKASLYTDSKDAIVRNLKCEIEDADQDLQVLIKSTNIYSAMTVYKAKNSTPVSLPIQIIEAFIVLCNDTDLNIKFKEYQERARIMDRSVQEYYSIIDQDHYSGESARIKYPSKWTQPPISIVIDPKEIINLQAKILQLNQTLGTIQISTITEISNIARGDYEIEYQRRCNLSDNQNNQTSLLDGPIDTSEYSNNTLVDEIEGLIKKLISLRDQRLSEIKELSLKVLSDDIIQSLVLNQGREEEVFKKELMKFKPYEIKIHENIEEHCILLSNLSANINLFKQSRLMLDLDIVSQRRERIESDWQRQLILYNDTKGLLLSIDSVINDTESVLMAVKRKVLEITSQRNLERLRLISRLDFNAIKSSHPQKTDSQTRFLPPSFSSDNNQPIEENEYPFQSYTNKQTTYSAEPQISYYPAKISQQQSSFIPPDNEYTPNSYVEQHNNYYPEYLSKVSYNPSTTPENNQYPPIKVSNPPFDSRAETYPGAKTNYLPPPLQVPQNYTTHGYTLPQPSTDSSQGLYNTIKTASDSAISPCYLEKSRFLSFEKGYGRK